MIIHGETSSADVSRALPLSEGFSGRSGQEQRDALQYLFCTAWLFENRLPFMQLLAMRNSSRLSPVR
jgi:hypothetical protein